MTTTEIANNPEKSHFGYLDGWRGMAILFLLIGHFFPIPGINLGTVGVNLFFVLSGFLMCNLLFIKNSPLSIFIAVEYQESFQLMYFLS